VITQTQASKQVRNQGVGASEVASILGLDPRRSAYDLWALKTEKHEETGEAETTQQQTIGNLIEPTTAAVFEQETGLKLVKPTGTYKAENGIMFANLDRQVGVARRGAPNCELKSTGFVDGWGDPDTDQVPDMVMVQVHAQMICSGSDFSYVARLLGRFGFSFTKYNIPRNNDLARAIEDRVEDFWNNHVVKDIPPEHSLPSIGVVSHFNRQTGKAVPIDLGVVQAWMQARDERLEVEKKEDQAKANLLAALGDAEIGEAPGLRVSYVTVTTNRLDTTALKAAHPEIVSAFTKPSGYRKLTTKKEK
jgi:putative phage-type endonuclease